MGCELEFCGAVIDGGMCPCGKVGGAAASSISRIDAADSGAAACVCYPANKKCPTAVFCGRDKGEPHVELASGMVRSDNAGKPDFTLIDLALLERWAVHMTKNVASKGHNNWRQASTGEDLARFRESAWRHFVQWVRGDTDEDHAAALLFNVAGAEMVASRLDS